MIRTLTTAALIIAVKANPLSTPTELELADRLETAMTEVADLVKLVTA